MFKVPAFVSKKLNSFKTKQEKDQFIQAYKNWYNNDVTKLLVQSLEKDIQNGRESEEKQNSFLSRFDFNFKQAYGRGERQALSKLLKQLNYEVQDA